MQAIVAPHIFLFEEVQSLLNSSKLFLKNLDLYFHEKGSKFKNLLHKFGSGSVTTVESIFFMCNLPPANSFDGLVAMNKPLRDVSIYIYTSEEEELAEDIVWERVIEIAECSLSTDGDVNIYERSHVLYEICRVKHWHRRIRVTIFGR